MERTFLRLFVIIFSTLTFSLSSCKTSPESAQLLAQDEGAADAANQCAKELQPYHDGIVLGVLDRIEASAFWGDSATLGTKNVRFIHLEFTLNKSKNGVTNAFIGENKKKTQFDFKGSKSLDESTLIDVATRIGDNTTQLDIITNKIHQDPIIQGSAVLLNDFYCGYVLPKNPISTPANPAHENEGGGGLNKVK